MEDESKIKMEALRSPYRKENVRKYHHRRAILV